jgi:ribosomal protein L12E/L44/L45/RPP1/RPP2
MNIQAEQHIKCIFRNGTIIEGIVRAWSKEEAVLLSLNDASLMVILHPYDDVMLIKIMSEEISAPTTATAAPTSSRAQEIADAIKAKAAEEEQPEPDEQTLHAMTAAQLHIELAEQERRIVADKLRDHYPGLQTPRKKSYGYPGFFQKPRAK